MAFPDEDKPGPRVVKVYGLECRTAGSKEPWRDAGEVYCSDTRRECRSQMVFVNFFGMEVRMVQWTTVRRVASKVLDMTKLYR